VAISRTRYAKAASNCQLSSNDNKKQSTNKKRRPVKESNRALVPPLIAEKSLRQAESHLTIMHHCQLRYRGKLALLTTVNRGVNRLDKGCVVTVYRLWEEDVLDGKDEVRRM
jgi:hypothetical protein